MLTVWAHVEQAGRAADLEQLLSRSFFDQQVISSLMLILRIGNSDPALHNTRHLVPGGLQVCYTLCKSSISDEDLMDSMGTKLACLRILPV